MSSTQEKPVKNTDIELWREPTNEPGHSYYMPSIHVTQAGKIGISVGGSVYEKSLTEWHELAGGPLVQSPNPSDQSTQEKPRDRVMALPEELRKELLYLAHLDPEKQKSTLFHNVAVSGERIQALIDSAKREARDEAFGIAKGAVQAVIDEYPPFDDECYAFARRIEDYIAQLEQSEESK